MSRNRKRKNNTPRIPGTLWGEFKGNHNEFMELILGMKKYESLKLKNGRVIKSKMTSEEVFRLTGKMI